MDAAAMDPFVSYRPELWQPLVNRTPAGQVGHRKRKIKKPCATAGCHYHVVKGSDEHRLSRVCPVKVGGPIVGASAHAEEPPVRCDDSAARISAGGVRLLFGVHSGPASVDRRDSIRSTWMKWQRGTSTLVCFLLGKSGVEPTQLQRTEEEAARWRDVLWLTFNATEGARPRLTIAKAAAWWQAAVHMLGPGSSTLVGRADDDTFVVLPRLHAHLQQLGCVRHLCYGPMAYVGYNPATYAKCGWGWAGDGNYYKYLCEATGAQPPFPFPFGTLQVLSAAVVRHLARSRELRRFVAQSEEVTAATLGGAQDLHARPFDQAEDAALGFWLSRAQLQRRLNLTYVDVMARTPNLACYRRRGLYQIPQPGLVALHYIKKAEGMQFAWKVLHDGAKMEPKACHLIARKWGVDI